MTVSTSRGYLKAEGTDEVRSYGKTALAATLDLIDADMVAALSGTLAGNLTFSGTGRRILADLSNGTEASRLFFQTSTVNGNSNLGLLPNGTATTSILRVYNGSDPANAGFLHFAATATVNILNSNKNGTGTAVDFSILMSSVTALTLAQTTLSATFAGQIVGSAGTTTRATLRIPHGAAPTSPVDGDVWSTSAGLFVRINGATVGPLS